MIFNAFSRLRLKYKIFLGTMVFLMPVLILGNVAIYRIQRAEIEAQVESELATTNKSVVNLVRTATEASVRNYLRGLADFDRQQVSAIYRDFTEGRINEAEAKARARRILIGQKVGDTGYVYVLDSKGKVLIHPNDRVEGTDVSGQAFVRDQMARRNGYLEYDWRNPGEPEARQKALYMVYFEPWDWIISVSSYRSEFDRLVVIDDFRDRIKAVPIHGDGYVFVLRNNGDILVGPLAGRSVFSIEDSVVKEKTRQVLAMRRGAFRYISMDSGTGRKRERLVQFQDLRELGWIIGTTVFADDYEKSLIQFRRIMIASTLLTLLLAALLAIVMGGYVTRPLTRLMARIQGGVGANGAEDWNTGDEVRAMAGRYAEIMDNVRHYSADLEAEVQVREKAESELQIYREMFLNAIEGITVTDADARIIAVNPAFTQITGYSADEAVGRNPSLLRSAHHDEAFFKQMWDRLTKHGAWSGEIWNRHKDGSVCAVWLGISAIRNPAGETTNYIGVFRDITEAKEQEERIRFLAYHDALTSLANRSLLMDRLQRALLRIHRENHRAAVIFIDLDNFKTINDSLGHAIGDQLLVAFAHRLGKIMRSGDSLARLGGDEFVVVIEGDLTPTRIDLFASRVFGLLEKPFRVGEHDLHVTMSMGITLAPTDGDDVETLLKNADMAMYRAKDGGKNNYCYYRPEMDAEVRRWHRIHSEIRYGMERNEFRVFFQPKVEPVTGKVFGMEALARWITKDGEVIGPNEFIRVAEEAGLIEQLDRIILEQACGHTLEWLNAGHDLTVSVNLSPRHFQAADLPERIDEILARVGFPPDRLEIEITETAVMADVERSRSHMENLSKRGIGLAIDDFGRGYSSLSYISAFPVDTLKVDKKFVDGILVDDRESALVETIIHMAKRIGIKVVAEGVEEESQVRFLIRHACDGIQGYYYSRPLAPEAFAEYLRGGNRPMAAD